MFDEFFLKEYGDRWLKLKSALLQQEKQISLRGFIQPILKDYLENTELYNKSQYDSQMRNSEGYLENYILDPASLAPVYALDVKANHSVCDLCAAPGGKSLAIFSQLGSTGRLVCNDSSKDRFFRLKKVLENYIPSQLHERFKVTLKDGQKYGFYYKNEFDRVLVDAPCSSERHLLQNEKYLQQWTAKKSKMLSQKQYTLLCSALLICKSEGKIVYSTCSINSQENDMVVEKFLKKKSDQMSLDNDFSFDFLNYEKTKYGFTILPDQSGFGPIYFTRFVKK